MPKLTTIEIGRVSANACGLHYAKNRGLRVDIEIEFRRGTHGLTLGISGGVWNAQLTDYQTCGQIQDDVRSWLASGEFTKLNYPYKVLKQLLAIWDNHHLNDLHAECVHQEKLMPALKAARGDNFFYASNLDQIWSVPEFAKCSVCGYKYGSAWTYRALPDDVIAWLVQTFGAVVPSEVKA